MHNSPPTPPNSSPSSHDPQQGIANPTTPQTAPIPTHDAQAVPATPTASVPAAAPQKPADPVSQPTQATPQGRPARTVQLSREQILRITAESLLRQGYDKTTIRQIASMLDCAVGSIYRYFPDKRSLLAAVTQQILEPVAELLTGQTDSRNTDSRNASTVLDQSIALYVQRATAAPEVYRLMFWLASVGQTDAAAQPLPEVIGRIIDGWASLVGSKAGALRQWALVHGGLMLGLEEPHIALFANPSSAESKSAESNPPSDMIAARAASTDSVAASADA